MAHSFGRCCMARALGSQGHAGAGQPVHGKSFWSVRDKLDFHRSLCAQPLEGHVPGRLTTRNIGNLFEGLWSGLVHPVTLPMRQRWSRVNRARSACHRPSSACSFDALSGDLARHGCTVYGYDVAMPGADAYPPSRRAFRRKVQGDTEVFARFVEHFISGYRSAICRSPIASG